MISFIWAVLMLALWLFAVPFMLGAPFAGKLGKGSALVCGYMVMWAVFQVLCVGFILTTGSFDQVVYSFAGLTLAASFGILIGLWKKAMAEKKNREKSAGLQPETKQGQQETGHGKLRGAFGSLSLEEKIVWGLFFAILLFQLVMSVSMAFADGDDAFYIPISVATESSGTMYRTIPYTGESTLLDIRHGLAPFPVWIAFLSRVSGIHATILAQSILGGVLLMVCYLIYWQIGKLLFSEKKEGIPYFLLLTAILFLVGNTSFYTAETFLVTRTSQGKAVLAALVLPFAIWCLLGLSGEYEKKQEKSRERIRAISVLLLADSLAACLCSTLGTFLCGALVGVSGLVLTVKHRNFKILLRAVCFIAPSAVYALLYLILQ